MANPNIAKLKKRAAEFEAKKQFDRALSLYIQLLEEAGRDLDDADLQLFNRVGDLLQRQGNVSEALAYYEKAVDVYAERGFLNNAIALCNKILRQSPARTAVYYKLGKISASKGFKSDAKKNFLEYADRMQKAGHVDEAFRALKEFADLCPDQDDIRLMLAEWLNRENRKSEAIEQLEVLYSKLESEGRQAEARATIDRIKAIDPEVIPRVSGAWQSQKTNDLVFLDLDASVAPPPAAAAGGAEAAAAPEPRPQTPATPASPRIPALDGLILTFDPETDETPWADQPAAASRAVEGFESTGNEVDAESMAVDAEAMPGFERADAVVAPDDIQVTPLLATEARQAFASPEEPIPLIAGLETPRISLSGAHPALAPLLDEPPMSGTEFADLSLHEHAAPSPTTSPTARHDLALPSDLPLMGADEAPVDLLSVVSTPVGSDLMSSGATPELPDRDALAPMGAGESSLVGEVVPVTGSQSPIVIDESAAPSMFTLAFGTANAAAEAPPEAAAAETDGLPDEPRTVDASATSTGRGERDTSELMAVDGTARSTDEILIVPSEVIDEETKRSLRLEFALDGDETPDAWVEAALDSRDNRSLDRAMDHLLTPLGMAAIDPTAFDATEGSSESPPHGRAVDEAPAEAARHADEPNAAGDEDLAVADIELSPVNEVAPAVPAFDLLDELTPPFMRHGAESEEAAWPPADGAHEDAVAAESALDVEALRALVDRRDEVAALDRERAAAPGAAGTAADAIADVDMLLDERQIEAAFEDAAVELPMLDVEGVAHDDVVIELTPDIDVARFSVDELLGEAPSFGAEATLQFTPAPLFDDASSDEDDLDSRNDAANEGEVARDAVEPSSATDEWPADAAPEVLIDGEWRHEHMGDLVSGEVRAVTSFDAEGPRRTPRFDDLSAALMWPAEFEADGTPAGADAADRASTAGASEWVRTGMRSFTPHSSLSFGGVEAQLRRRLEIDPSNLALRQQLGEALLDQGAREDGLAELDAVMRGHEASGNLEAARAVADIVLRVVPTSVRHHQKRVEYAVRANDRVRLVEAYVELADSLFRSGEPDKARVVYARVLELSPSNGRARFALGLLEDEEGATGSSAAPNASAPPSTRAALSALFDPAVARPTPLRGSTPQFVTLPMIEETLDHARGAGGAPVDGLDDVNVHALVAGERLDAAQRQMEARDAAIEGIDAAPDTPEEASVAPFPPPSLDEAIDAAFAAPPVVEIAPRDGGAAHVAATVVEDFSGTPPMGAAALVTPFAGDNAPEPVDESYRIPGHASDDAAVADQGSVAAAPGAEPLLPSGAVAGNGGRRPASAPQGVPAVANEGDRTGQPIPAVDPTTTDDDFVDLGSWLRDDEPVRSTRMVTADAPPTGDEQADFNEMLRRFKQGVAANVDEEDYASHYDLGVAYKEMGLMDEAIAEFQKSLRGDTHRVRSYEALGQCFVEKRQHQVAVTLLRRAVESTGADDQQLVGVLYLLGYASEVMARHADALGYYQRVFAVDIDFRDVAQRVAAMEHKTQ